MDFSIIRQKLAWAQYLSDITMSELGSEIDINNAAVSQTLSGKYKMTARFLIITCSCLDISVGWVVGEATAKTRLELIVQEKIDSGAKLTIKMKRSKAGKKPKPRKKNDSASSIFLRRENFKNKLLERQKQVQNYLKSSPEKNNKWIAEECGVLPKFVELERKSLELSTLIGSTLD